ncbi:hypothetical protein ACOME3_008358 [Neoechinorhynchus agilis]
MSRESHGAVHVSSNIPVFLECIYLDSMDSTNTRPSLVNRVSIRCDRLQFPSVIATHRDKVSIALDVIREAFELLEPIRPFLKCTKNNIRRNNFQMLGCITGSRRTDPNCENLLAFQSTDPGWGGFIRICPIIEWTFDDVWRFIRNTKIAYCSLYDSGFTSIGTTTNTRPHSRLRHPNGYYLPAHALSGREFDEREGRSA